MADNREAVFDVAGAKRIVEQVRWAEAQPRGPADPLPSGGPSTRFEFWAAITDSAAWTGNPNKWWYSWVEKRITATGWETVPGGRTGDKDADTAAINGYETNNPSTPGMMGIGVDTSAEDITLQPFGHGTYSSPPIVRMFVDLYEDGSGFAVAAYSFSEPNFTTCGS